MLRQQLQALGLPPASPRPAPVSAPAPEKPRTGIAIDGLLARGGWPALLPLAAIPALMLGAQAERLTGAARTATAERARLTMHLFGLTIDAAPAKELRSSGLSLASRLRPSAWIR